MHVSIVEPYMEGEEDLVRRFVTPGAHVEARAVPIMNLLAKSKSP